MTPDDVGMYADWAELYPPITSYRENEVGTSSPPKSQGGPAFIHAGQAWAMQSTAAFVAGFVPPEYIVDGVIQRGRLYTLTAPTGSGKTAVMILAAMMIATGELFGDRAVEEGDVVFMAGENPDDVRARVIATLERHGIDPAQCRVHFIPGTFSIRSDIERLREVASALPNLVLAIIDTFAAYFDGDDENSNAQALAFAKVAREITAFPSRPAVVMPAHPVKNATRQNLAPKGGSSLVNEVDGNLTLWNDEGVLTLHWQVKIRGPDFQPIKFELETYESDSLRDHKGRYIPTVLAKPLLEVRAREIVKETLSREDRVLLSIEANPGLSLAERALATDVRLTDGQAHKTGVSRILQRLEKEKLVRKFRSNWELTKNGEKAVELIKQGAKHSPDLSA